MSRVDTAESPIRNTGVTSVADHQVVVGGLG
jgi:hypothetical protein